MSIWDEKTWLFINTFAPWLSALGTIAAVIVSLRLARSATTPKLRVSAGVDVIIGSDGVEYPKYLSVRVTNIGNPDAEVNGIGWEAGIFRIHNFAQFFDWGPFNQQQLPVRLKFGEGVTMRIPMEDKWRKEFAQKVLGPRPRLSIYRMRVVATTSVGLVFKARVSPDLKRALLRRD